MDDRGVCFLSIIWPTNEKNVESISSIILKEGHSIKSIFRYEFESSWEDMIRIFYQDDHVLEKNIVNKIATMSVCGRFVYLIYINVVDPKYRLKGRSRRISSSMELLKMKIRGVFGDKKSINNPIHIVDEHSHTFNIDNKLSSYGKLIFDDKCKRIVK